MAFPCRQEKKKEKCCHHFGIFLLRNDWNAHSTHIVNFAASQQWICSMMIGCNLLNFYSRLPIYGNNISCCIWNVCIINKSNQSWKKWATIVWRKKKKVVAAVIAVAVAYFSFILSCSFLLSLPLSHYLILLPYIKSGQ